MNLKSCENCGIVIDENAIKLLPDDAVDSDGQCLGIYMDNSFYKYWVCPVCKEENASDKRVD